MLKNVVVTGTSTGIGRAAALLLDERGYRVFATVRRPADAASLQAEGSDRLHPIVMDLTDEASVEEAMKEVAGVVGPTGLHGLVNNAGVGMGGPVEFLPLDDWRHQFEVNVFGQVAVTRHAMPMIRDARGRVVFVGSIGGRIATPINACYSASKFAINAVADSFRREVAEWGIKVVLVEPGGTVTAIRETSLSWLDDLEKRLPERSFELYGHWFDSARDGLADEKPGSANPPEAVAEVIHTALTAPKPRPRYPVGKDAKMAALIARFVPDRALEAAFRRMAPKRT